MAAPSTPEEIALVAGANEYLDSYQGNSKFLNDLLGKRARIQGFQLSVRQAEVVVKIADEEHDRQQKNAEEPF